MRACVLDLEGRSRGSWEQGLELMEFAYNNSYQASIGMAPYEALYGRRCRSPICWFETGERELTGAELIDQTTEVIRMVRENLQTAQSRQRSYADRRRRPLQFEGGDRLRGRRGRCGLGAWESGRHALSGRS